MARQYKKDELREMLNAKLEQAEKRAKKLYHTINYWYLLDHKDKEKAKEKEDAASNNLMAIEEKIDKMKACLEIIDELEDIYNNIKYYEFSKIQPVDTEEQNLCGIYCEKVWVNEDPYGSIVYLEAF